MDSCVGEITLKKWVTRGKNSGQKSCGLVLYPVLGVSFAAFNRSFPDKDERENAIVLLNCSHTYAAKTRTDGEPIFTCTAQKILRYI